MAKTKEERDFMVVTLSVDRERARRDSNPRPPDSKSDALSS
jgi:hypothetical protein